MLLIGSSLITNGWAQRRSAAKRTSTTALNMQSQGQGSIVVTFTASPDGTALSGVAPGRGVLNLGTVSYASGARMSNVQMRHLDGRFVVTTRFGMNIQDPAQRFSSATVLASMALPEPYFTLRLDGTKMETTPQVIQGRVRVGETLQHRLEIEVPTSLTEKNSQLQNAIVFQVVPN
ncbi:MAG TPA: hypothetical protein VKL40_14920 [Candidatus Angelobacter sp.]|nr:hypothetical protein [Candidatus Angelobacter sp.]